MLKVLLFLASLILAVSSAKVDHELAERFKFHKTANVFVKFQGGNQKAISAIQHLEYKHRANKIEHLVGNLKSFSFVSQSEAIKLVQERSAKYTQFWINNELYIEAASESLVKTLTNLPEVTRIYEEIIFPFENLVDSSNSKKQAEVEWNIAKVEAPGAWEMSGGNKGENAVVASIDTGVRHTHEALRNNFRENYGWFDPYDATTLPADENGHGTHVMGIIAGSGGIGVAPGSQWITCRGCGSFSCTQSALLACGAWILCPTTPNGNTSDCSTAPNVVSNSWGGGSDSTWFNDVLNAWKAANIVPIFAMGGTGPSCGTVGSPGDQSVLTVGGTGSNDAISSRSSRGPTSDGRIKPEIVAPSENIRSAWGTSDTTYNTLSGTSMSAPHVAGAAAILLSENPLLSYSEVVKLLEDNADTNLPATTETCGGIPSDVYPNNIYGHGRLNVRRALEDALSP